MCSLHILIGVNFTPRLTAAFLRFFFGHLGDGTACFTLACVIHVIWYVTQAAGCRMDSNCRTRIIRCNIVALLAGSTTIALGELGCVRGLGLLGATLIPSLGVAATVVRDLAGEGGGD